MPIVPLEPAPVRDKPRQQVASFADFDAQALFPEDYGFTDPNQTQRIDAMASALDERTARGRYARQVEPRRNVHLHLLDILISKFDERLEDRNGSLHPSMHLNRTGFFVQALSEVCARTLRPVLLAEAESPSPARDFDPRPISNFRFEKLPRGVERRQLMIPVPLPVYSDLDTIRDLARRSECVPDLNLTVIINRALEDYAAEYFVWDMQSHMVAES